jgi:hypothetical protein
MRVSTRPAPGNHFLFTMRSVTVAVGGVLEDLQ